MSFDPWSWLRQLEHLTLVRHSPAETSAYGFTEFATATISLRDDLNQAGRRSTLTHEILHATRGPTLNEPALAAREELRVCREAARLLLPDIQAVGEALAATPTCFEAAAELWVDEDTLLDRLEDLSPDEVRFLRERLADPADFVHEDR